MFFQMQNKPQMRKKHELMQKQIEQMSRIKILPPNFYKLSCYFRSRLATFFHQSNCFNLKISTKCLSLFHWTLLKSVLYTLLYTF